MIKFILAIALILIVPVLGYKGSVTVSVASVGWRKEGLEKTLQTIVDQADYINVFLQDYGSIPDFLHHPKITVVLGEEYPEAWAKGAGAKFFWANAVRGYHFVIDDDILYPANYVEYCIEKIEYYQRKAVVGFHGSIFNPVIEDYTKSKQNFFWFLYNLPVDSPVHMLGTGQLAYHTDTILVSMSDFRYHNMADLQFALIAQKQQIPLVCLSRPDNYIKEILHLSRDPRSISLRVISNDQRTIIAQAHKWVIYKP